MLCSCSVSQKGQYRNGAAKFFPENIPPNLCTHIIYAFATLKNGILSTYEWNDEGIWVNGVSLTWLTFEVFKFQEMYGRMMALKKTNSDLKILIAVGGKQFYLFYFPKMFVMNDKKTLKAGTLDLVYSAIWYIMIKLERILLRQVFNFWKSTNLMD
jgi:hypothetical protein